MCSKPPKPKTPVTPAPVKAPEIDLGGEGDKVRRVQKRRGRTQLRTGLSIGSSRSGLSIQE